MRLPIYILTYLLAGGALMVALSMLGISQMLLNPLGMGWVYEIMINFLMSTNISGLLTALFIIGTIVIIIMDIKSVKEG